MIIKCLCEHAEQDRLHGKGNRVANLTFAGDKARCTVCKILISSGLSPKASKKKKESK